MLDLLQLLPNSKKDAKLDTKSQRQVINEVADLKVRRPPFGTQQLHILKGSKPFKASPKSGREK